MKQAFIYIFLIIGFTLLTSCNLDSPKKANESAATTVETEVSHESQKANDDEKVLHGLHEKHYPNGQLKSSGYYNNGQKTGMHKEWLENGQISKEGVYKNGKANGPMKWYSEKGHLSAFGKMKDEKRIGIWKICDWQDANFCAEGMFENEVEVGSWKSYHANGNLQRENIWKDGKVVSSKCWDYNGMKIDCD